MTMYARANLMDFNDKTGWSLTSGGPSANALPSGYEGIVFDQNSGPSRTITGNVSLGVAYVSSFDMTNSAPMTFTAIQRIQSGGLSTLKGTFAGGLQFWNGGGTDAHHLDASQAIVASYQGSGDSAVVLMGDLVVTGGITLSGSTFNQSLYANGYNITCAALSSTGAGTDSNGASTKSYFSMSSGVLTLTGTGAVLSIAANSGYLNGTTVVVTDQSDAVKTVSAPSISIGTLINNTGNGRGTGGINLYSGPMTFGTFDAGKAMAVTAFNGGSAYSATNWILDGSGQLLTLKSNTTSANAILIKNGGGTIAANFCNFSYITMGGSPATTARATNSKMNNSTGITLVGQTSRAMVFF
jgi:hypothetical protein